MDNKQLSDWSLELFFSEEHYKRLIDRYFVGEALELTKDCINGNKTHLVIILSVGYDNEIEFLITDMREIKNKSKYEENLVILVLHGTCKVLDSKFIKKFISRFCLYTSIPERRVTILDELMKPHIRLSYFYEEYFSGRQEIRIEKLRAKVYMSRHSSRTLLSLVLRTEALQPFIDEINKERKNERTS